MGFISGLLGRWDESVRLYERAISLDPLWPLYHIELSSGLYSIGRMREAEAKARRVLEIRPTFDGGHYWLGYVLLAEGKLGAALAEMQQEHSNSGLAYVYFAMGRRSESDTALAELVQKHAGDAAYDIALVYAYRHELDQAFTWLEQAYRQRESGLITLKSNQVDPLMMSFAQDPRFASFLRKMNLPE